MLATTLAGRYRLQSEVAQGGMATVWKATDEVLARVVAAKILHAHLAQDEVFAERFRREAMSAASLQHPNIVSIFDTGEQDGVPFIVMELLEGGTLKDLMAAGPVLDPGRICTLGAGVCAALRHAHEAGVIHRDIKPANILFSETGHLKVGDFSIAKAAAGEDLTTSGSVMGTVRYAAPEVLRGEDAGPPSDLYSLGLVLYECLTGRQPFEAGSEMAAAMARLDRDPPRPSDLRPQIPRALDSAVMKALRRDPEERFADAAEMAGALAGAGGAETTVFPAARRGAPAAPRHAPQVDPAASFVRSEGRWILPIVLLSLVAAGLVVAVLHLTGTVRIPLITGGGPGGGSVPAIKAAGAYDPEGEGHEREDLVPKAIDNDPSTAWRTHEYRTDGFGGLKHGVGIWIDLGQDQKLKSIDVTSVSPGWSGTLRYSEDAKTWTPPGQDQVVGEKTHTFATDGTHRYYMVWITRLTRTTGQGSDENPFSVGIAEITPRR